MSFPNRERSSSLFIISEGQFYSKPSLKLERLEKDYSELKRKENEDGIELRRLRTENLLLQQRIANLEKESATLAHKLVRDKVIWAQEVEQLFAVRARLSITLRQLRESQNQLHDAENTVDELSKKNRISTDQIRRVGENNKDLRELLEEITQDKNVLQSQINILTRKLDDAESTRQAEAIIARIKDAESMQRLAELRRKLAEIDIQKVEKLAMGQIRNQAHCYPLVTSLCDLQDQQHLEYQLNVPDVCAHRGHRGMTDSRQWASKSEASTDCRWASSSDEEFDALVQDSEHLERTLSDIIEGRQNSSKTLKNDAKEGFLSDSRDCRLESNISDNENYVPISYWHRTNMAVQCEAGTCDSRQCTSDTVAGLANVDDISGDNIVATANVDDISDDEVAGMATAGDSIDDTIVGVANIGYADDKTAYGSSFAGLSKEKTACVANGGCADGTADGGLANGDKTDENGNGVRYVDDTNDDNIVGVVTTDDSNDNNIVGVVTTDDINNDNIVGATDDINNDNIVGVVTADYMNAEKKFGVSNANITDVKMAGLAKGDVTNETMIGVAKEDITQEKIVCLSNDHITDTTNVGRANDHHIRDEKVIVVANASPVGVAQCESRFKRVGEIAHDVDVYESSGGVGAVVHLFGYKSEATLLLKESTV